MLHSSFHLIDNVVEDDVFKRLTGKNNDKAPDRPRFSDFNRYGSLGIELPMSIIIGIFLGIWIGSMLGSKKLGALGGLVLGLAAVTRTLWKLMCHRNEDRK